MGLGERLLFLPAERFDLDVERGAGLGERLLFLPAERFDLDVERGALEVGGFFFFLVFLFTEVEEEEGGGRDLVLVGFGLFPTLVFLICCFKVLRFVGAIIVWLPLCI